MHSGGHHVVVVLAYVRLFEEALADVAEGG